MKNTKELRKWAKEVKEMYVGCAICGKEERLNAHHILPKELEDTRLDLLNGIALCPLHHRFSRRI